MHGSTTTCRPSSMYLCFHLHSPRWSRVHATLVRVPCAMQRSMSAGDTGGMRVLSTGCGFECKFVSSVFFVKAVSV